MVPAYRIISQDQSAVRQFYNINSTVVIRQNSRIRRTPCFPTVRRIAAENPSFRASQQHMHRSGIGFPKRRLYDPFSVKNILRIQRTGRIRSGFLPPPLRLLMNNRNHCAFDPRFPLIPGNIHKGIPGFPLYRSRSQPCTILQLDDFVPDRAPAAPIPFHQRPGTGPEISVLRSHKAGIPLRNTMSDLIIQDNLTIFSHKQDWIPMRQTGLMRELFRIVPTIFRAPGIPNRHILRTFF